MFSSRSKFSYTRFNAVFDWYKLIKTTVLCGCSVLIYKIISRINNKKPYFILSDIDPELIARNTRFPVAKYNAEYSTFYEEILNFYANTNTALDSYSVSLLIFDYLCLCQERKIVPALSFEKISRKLYSNREKLLIYNNHYTMNLFALVCLSSLTDRSLCSSYLSQAYHYTEELFDNNGLNIEGSSSYQILFTLWIGRLLAYIENSEIKFCCSDLLIIDNIKRIFDKAILTCAYLAICTNNNSFWIGDISPDLLGYNVYDYSIISKIINLKQQFNNKLFSVFYSNLFISSLPYSNKITVSTKGTNNNLREYDHSHYDIGSLTWTSYGNPVLIDTGRDTYGSTFYNSPDRHNTVNVQKPFSFYKNIVRISPPKNHAFCIDKIHMNPINNRIIYDLKSLPIEWSRIIDSLDSKLIIYDKFVAIQKKLILNFQFFFAPGYSMSNFHINSNIHDACLETCTFSQSYGENINIKMLKFHLCIQQNSQTKTVIDVSTPDKVKIELSTVRSSV